MNIFNRVKCPYCGKRYSAAFNKLCPYCDNVDLNNILWVSVTKREELYHEEESEEFDPVMSDFLTQQDGWQHYETQTVTETVFDGIEYTFLIFYKNKTSEQRTYHESSSNCRRLLEKADKNPITECIDNVTGAISNAFKVVNDNYFKREIETASSQPIGDRKEKAVEEAKNIIGRFGCSYKNMITALERDLKFTHEEAAFGADNCGADWKKEALRAAKKCIESNCEYSFEKMIFQLSILNFTQEEAEHAVLTLNLPHDSHPDKYQLNA